MSPCTIAPTAFFPTDEPDPLTAGESRMLRDHLERLYFAIESGDAARIARVERKASSLLAGYYPGRAFIFADSAWLVDDSTPEGKVRRFPMELLD